MVGRVQHVKRRLLSKLLADGLEQFRLREAVTRPRKEQHRDRHTGQVFGAVCCRFSGGMEREAEEDDASDGRQGAS